MMASVTSCCCSVILLEDMINKMKGLSCQDAA